MSPAAGVPLNAVDWSAPWLASLARWRAEIAADDVREALSDSVRARGLTTGLGQPLRFVDAADAGATSYEAHIARTGRVPTRNNLHDLFNATVWLSFPRSKAALNARQVTSGGLGDELEPASRTGRGAVRDAATLFDESGLILAVAGQRQEGERVRTLIATHAWRELFVEQRASWHRVWMPWLFGHAVMEKLCRPYPAIVVRAWVLALDASGVGDPAAVDNALAAQIAEAVDLSPQHLPPLPVLGVPGWWPANEDAAFYDDATVFRPRRIEAEARIR